MPTRTKTPSRRSAMKPVRQSVTIPASLVPKVRHVAKERHLTLSRALVSLAERGVRAQLEVKESLKMAYRRFMDEREPARQDEAGKDLIRAILGKHANCRRYGSLTSARGLATPARTRSGAQDHARRSRPPAGVGQVGTRSAGGRLVQGFRLLQAVRRRRVPSDGSHQRDGGVWQGNRINRPRGLQKFHPRRYLYVVGSWPLALQRVIFAFARFAAHVTGVERRMAKYFGED